MKGTIIISPPKVQYFHEEGDKTTIRFTSAKVANAIYDNLSTDVMQATRCDRVLLDNNELVFFSKPHKRIAFIEQYKKALERSEYQKHDVFPKNTTNLSGASCERIREATA